MQRHLSKSLFVSISIRIEVGGTVEHIGLERFCCDSGKTKQIYAAKCACVCVCVHVKRSRSSSVITVTRLRGRQPGFDLWQRKGEDIFLFTTASRPVLGPTQHPVQRGNGGCLPGSKTAGA
jgi:hypothetical protein